TSIKKFEQHPPHLGFLEIFFLEKSAFFTTIGSKMTQKPQKMTQFWIIQKQEAKSSKERDEKLKRDKAALEKGRLKREKQSKSDDDENVAQQGDGLPIDKEAIRKQYSSSSGGGRGSGGNSRPSMNRHSWRCPICTLMNDPAVLYCARSMMSPSSNERKVSLRSLFEDDNLNNEEVRVASKH
ncbi:hypothetical protein RFI_38129, partial [Reticulomyxa filosa]